jgi:hypothetical protein
MGKIIKVKAVEYINDNKKTINKVIPKKEIIKYENKEIKNGI